MSSNGLIPVDLKTQITAVKMISRRQAKIEAQQHERPQILVVMYEKKTNVGDYAKLAGCNQFGVRSQFEFPAIKRIIF